MSKQQYLYKKSAFKHRPVRLEHMDLAIRFLENRIETTNTLFLTALQDTPSVTLDARDIKILSACRLNSETPDLKTRYSKRKHKLTLTPATPLKTGESITIEIKSTFKPSDNILEGIYKDTTPPDAPTQYMSQCQQWGFQRIMPVIDDCTAKCTMTTTLEGDARYTHLISNGNISRTANPDGKPVPLRDDPSRISIRYENMIPMAPYLFIACAGTWDELSDSITYPSGRRVRLEYLVPPGRIDGAKLPMEILKHSMLWHAETQDYEYKREVYRTICMEKSNFGGMENVGNTTIVTDAALIDDFISDAHLEYAHGVIIHEFEHNQCGSDVTMETPFDMWLNEAFTVDVERQYTSSRFDPVCQRLDHVETIRSPIGGPLAIEDAGHQGNIVRTGFNDPDELVDGVTYVKAPEVINMLRLIIGQEKFIRGKNLYFYRHTGGNANTDEFFACFEEASGQDLSAFKKQWLYTIGYPVINAEWSYARSSKTLRIRLSQSRTGKGRLFHVPITLSAVDNNGQDIKETAGTVEMSGKKLTLSFKNVPEPAFVSFNRDSSFYGSFEDKTAGVEELIRQAQIDPNHFNRVEAMRKFTDIQRIAIIKNPEASADPRWLDIYNSIIGDSTTGYGLKAYMLRIDEQSMDRSYLPCYVERNRARSSLMKQAAANCKNQLVSLFNRIDTYTRTSDPADGMEARSLKNTILRILTELDSADIHKIAEDHLKMAWNMSDKTAALMSIQLSSNPQRKAILETMFNTWKDHLNGYTAYLAVIASGIQPDVFDQIADEENRECFSIQHPSHSRALFMPMCSNNRMLWTDDGQNWLAESIVKLSEINDYTAARMAGCLQMAGRMPELLKLRVIQTLQETKNGINPKKAPAAAGRIDAFLKGATDNE